MIAGDNTHSHNPAGALAAAWFRQLTGADVPVKRPVGYDDLTAYKRGVWKRYEHTAHLGALDARLMDVSRYVESTGREGIGRLIIAMPPRHGKTLTTSRLYPTWHLGRNPHHRVMLVSYGQDLANKNSRAARNIIRSRVYRDVFGIELAPDSQSVMSWDIADAEGGMDALGIGAGATGKGAHLLIIDDPIKSREQAESITYRDKIYEAFTDDLYTRLEPGGAVVVMATRWHEDDLTGRILRNQSERWHVLSLPSIAGDDDPLGRVPGEALWPGRYPLDVLEEIRDTLGPYSWASLHEQNPRPAEGGIFKSAWFQPYERAVPDNPRIRVRYWDLAMSEKTSADYTVGVRMERGPDGVDRITDVARARVELADLPKFIGDVMRADGPGVLQGFENAGYMTRAIQVLAKDATLRKHSIKGYDVDRDKLTRALPYAARASLGLVKVRYAFWAQDFIEEHAAFPAGAHDDQVDAAAGAYLMCNEAEKRKPIEAKASRYA